MAGDGNPGNVPTNNSTSFKYKSSLFKKLKDTDNGVFKNVKIAVSLKHLTNFWRCLKIPLIICKIHLELNWTKDCVMSTIANTIYTIFKITNKNNKVISSNCYFMKQRQYKTGKTIRKRT